MHIILLTAFATIPAVLPCSRSTSPIPSSHRLITSIVLPWARLLDGGLDGTVVADHEHCGMLGKGNERELATSHVTGLDER